jgi:hypothetical protein
MIKRRFMWAMMGLSFALQINKVAATKGQQPIGFDSEHQIPVVLVTRS